MKMKRRYLLLTAVILAVGCMPKENIFEAARSGNLGRVRTLIEYDKRLLGVRDTEGTGVLSWAAAMGRLEVVKYLVSAGADLNSSNIIGITPLHFAAHNGQTDVVKFLLSKGADPTIKNREGITALGAAIKGKHEDTIELLRGTEQQK